MKIGVVIMLVELPGLDRALSFQEIRGTAERSEDLGFDSIWLYDHLLYRFGKRKPKTLGIWEGWSMLSALAAVTHKVELGTLVTCSSFRNPALLAKMAHTVDEISSGRLTLGLGAGWNQPEFDAFGIPFDHRADRFEEAIQIIRPLLKEGRVDFAGKYYRARDCEITPRSPRPGGPSLMVGSFGPRMMRLTARYADQWNTCYLSGPKALLRPRKALWKACAEEGRDPATLLVSGTVMLEFPDLMGKEKAGRGSLTGTVEDLAAALAGFEKLGVAHLMFHVVPALPAAYERLAAAVDLYRNHLSRSG